MKKATTLLRRLADFWTTRDEAAPDMDPRSAACADKMCPPEQAVEHINAGEHVFVGTACATPRTLVAALEARRPTPDDVELLHFLTDQVMPHDEHGLPLSPLPPPQPVCRPGHACSSAIGPC